MGTKQFFINSRLTKFKSLPAWCASWCLYLILVWGFAIIRINYLWIAGDDPNLISQAALTHNGLKPNLDFDSGYPGLSQFIQAGLMNIFGVNIFSQHLYAALLASLTGLLICMNFSRLPQWLLSLGLIFIYCQQHLVNPTPNPGHLFELLLLTIFTIINMRWIRSDRLLFCFSFVVMGAAFLSKQYAVFVLLGYAISQFDKAKWRLSDRKKYVILLCAGLSAASLYYLLLIPSGRLKPWAAISLFAMVLPFVVVIWASFRGQPNKQPQTLSIATRNVALGASIVFLSVVIGFAGLYQSPHLPHIFYQVLIEAPRQINDNTVLLSLSSESLVSVGAFLCFAISTVYLVFKQYSKETKRISGYIFQLLAMLIGVLAFTKIGNLSASLFLILFPITILGFYFSRPHTISSNRKQFFYVMACYQFVLIPYPNVNFHIMIFVVAFFILISDKYQMLMQTRMVHLWIFPIVLVSLLLFHEARTINAMKTYSFQEVQFKSGSEAWESAIMDAQNANGDLAECLTLGCKMLLLVSKG